MLEDLNKQLADKEKELATRRKEIKILENTSEEE